MAYSIDKQVSSKKRRPTKRAPDAGDSGAIPSLFLRLIIFLAGRLRQGPRNWAGNAIRWAVLAQGVSLESIVFNAIDEGNNFPALIKAIMQYLDYKKWGFSFEIPYAKHPADLISKIYFQSKFCKFKIHMFRAKGEIDSEIFYSYGRLHAPNTESSIIWNGKQCKCWHGFQNHRLVLLFLDGLSPQEVINRSLPYLPDIVEESQRKREPNWNSAESFAREHKMIWDHYGIRLFEFYDIRTPNLWNQYISFVKEIHALYEKKELPYKHFDIKNFYPADIC